VAVNQALANWSRDRLHVRSERVIYLPNFAGELADVPLEGALPGVAGKRIVQVANFRREKDHFTALRAMQRVVAACPGAHLLFVGAPIDQNYFAEVQAEVRKLSLQDHVTPLGQRRDVAAIMKSSDVGLLSSRSEGLPLALLEYSMAQLPTVATHTGQCFDVIGHPRCGRIGQPGDANAMADSLLELLASPELRRRLGQQFRQHVQDHFGSAAAARRIDGIYRKALNGAKRKKQGHALL
jgi:glycosyltransferase involved in cell wall biosynthesis